MTGEEVAAIIGGVGLIGLIGYYFFGPKGEAKVATMTDKKQLAMVTVDAAYIPNEIKLRAGVPTEITFDRQDKGDCTEWVIFSLPTKEGKEVKAWLAEGKQTVVRFTPVGPGK